MSALIYDGGVRESSFAQVAWRRKGIVITTVAVFAVTAALISSTLPKIYATSAKLLVAQPQDSQTFDAVQAAQVVARTYSDLLKSPNVAALVAGRIGGGATSGSIGGAVTIEPIAETQLIQITAEDRSPRRAQTIANAYADVFIQRSQVQLATTTKAKVGLADTAPLPSDAARPKPTLYTAIAALLGLGFGLGLAFLRDRLDTRLRTLEEIETVLNVPIIARVPRRGKTDVAIAAFTESYRVLRTNLQFATGEGAPRTIAVTSANEGEGKTTTSSQLALVTGATGTSVVAVEADMRRPNLQRYFVPDSPEPLRPGLSNFFLGGASINQIVHATTVPTVKFVPSGPTVPSLSGLMASERGPELVEQIAATGDMVIFDCPPLGLGADAATLAGLVDGVILVVDLETATKRSVTDALRQLAAVRAHVIGAVLNRDRTLEAVVYGYLEDGRSAARRAIEAGRR